MSIGGVGPVLNGRFFTLAWPWLKQSRRLSCIHRLLLPSSRCMRHGAMFVQSQGLTVVMCPSFLLEFSRPLIVLCFFENHRVIVRTGTVHLVVSCVQGLTIGIRTESVWWEETPQEFSSVGVLRHACSRRSSARHRALRHL